MPPGAQQLAVLSTTLPVSTPSRATGTQETLGSLLPFFPLLSLSSVSAPPCASSLATVTLQETRGFAEGLPVGRPTGHSGAASVPLLVTCPSHCPLCQPGSLWSSLSLGSQALITTPSPRQSLPPLSAGCLHMPGSLLSWSGDHVHRL